MAAFVIAEVEVTDPRLYDEYRKGVLATITAYGGRFLVRGGANEAYEGAPLRGRTVVLEFANMDKLRAWYRSPEYAPLLEMRKRCTTTRLSAVEGV